MGQGNLTTNLTNFELANPILVGEPNFNLANTNDHEHEQHGPIILYDNGVHGKGPFSSLHMGTKRD